MLCDELEGQDGGWERGERGGDVCIMADLCCHMAEANTTLYTFKNIYIKNSIKK